MAHGTQIKSVLTEARKKARQPFVFRGGGVAVVVAAVFLFFVALGLGFSCFVLFVWKVERSPALDAKPTPALYKQEASAV
jgi:hypothetical protein